MLKHQGVGAIVVPAWVQEEILNEHL